MELKQHQEMWLRELKYLNPNEWYIKKLCDQHIILILGW